MAREALLDRVSIPEAQVHPLRSTDLPLPDPFELILLGVGPDGHCASLFPGDPALEATEPIARVERPGLPPSHPRLTLTYFVLNGGRTTAFLVGGGEKRARVAQMLAGDESIPAARVQAPETYVLVDREADPTAG